ncbi:MAG: sodium/proton-translocating pyrophosphatase, partial [Clostridiales bacterium]|nr:sodium/proton-translocating pyrophosphatase [Clostridiales bacterium]
MDKIFQIAAILISFLAFAFSYWLFLWVKRQPSSNQKIAYIGTLIRNGARTFLRREYKVLAKFAGVIAVLILLFLPSPIWKGNFGSNIIMVVSFICGTVFSAIAGKIGIEVATIANIKSAEAAKKGIKPSFMAGFRGGAVMGMSVVGASLLGVTVVYLLTGDATTVLGFSFGASFLALFAKAGGGIFTKTADISADLTGKVELGIPEDDPRNPAVIADNVGDNVGDVAGMGADLFDSNVASMAAALVLAASIDYYVGGVMNVAMVFCFAALGLLASIIGVMTARIGKHGDPTMALNSSTYVTTAVFTVLTAIATAVCGFERRIWGACIIGL